MQWLFVGITRLQKTALVWKAVGNVLFATETV